MILMALLYFALGGKIIRVFTNDEAVIAAGTTAMLWVAAFQFFDAMNVTYSNALQGAGDTAWPSAVNLVISLVILFGGGLAVVTFLPGTASSGVWAVATLYVIAHGILYGLRWKSRLWQDRRFIQ
jgi:Na+-driven multidrug efflux pump